MADQGDDVLGGSRSHGFCDGGEVGVGGEGGAGHPSFLADAGFAGQDPRRLPGPFPWARKDDRGDVAEPGEPAGDPFLRFLALGDQRALRVEGEPGLVPFGRRRVTYEQY